MAWKEISVSDQRKLFIEDYYSEKFSISNLCKIYNISRPTAYLWIRRYEEEGETGLQNRNSSRHSQPSATPIHIIDEILNIRSERSTWGPKKIKAYLNLHKPELEIPSCTTIGNLLKRHGFIVQRKLRQRFAARTQPLAHVKEVNDVWSADFKGWFITQDKYKCEPFTLTDNASRYLLKCVKLNSNNETHVWGILDSAFREYGLPLYLRTDNGPPFGSKGIGRLTTLSVKLIKAGVIPDFIEPGKPEQNGRHERMHSTLKQEGISSEYTLEEQLRKFDKFRDYYNFERPHEGIGLITPGSIYSSSNREWRGKLKSPDYVDSFKKAKVRISGQIKLNGKNLFIGRALEGEYVGLEEFEDGFNVYYGPVALGSINLEGELIVPRREGRVRKKFKLEVY